MPMTEDDLMELCQKGGAIEPGPAVNGHEMMPPRDMDKLRGEAMETLRQEVYKVVLRYAIRPWALKFILTSLADEIDYE